MMSRGRGRGEAIDVDLRGGPRDEDDDARRAARHRRESITGRDAPSKVREEAIVHELVQLGVAVDLPSRDHRARTDVRLSRKRETFRWQIRRDRRDAAAAATAAATTRDFARPRCARARGERACGAARGVRRRLAGARWRARVAATRD
jgi:hypothetical protein